MVDSHELAARTEAPGDGTVTTLDARDLPPPEPLQRTLERVTELDAETALVQLNDRAPQHLYPKLDERGFSYETLESDSAVVTVIWRG